MCVCPYQSKEGFSPQSKASCSSLTRLACPGSRNRPSSWRPHCRMKSTHCSTSMGASLFPYRRSYRTVSSNFWPKIPETQEKMILNYWMWHLTEFDIEGFCCQLILTNLSLRYFLHNLWDTQSELCWPYTELLRSLRLRVLRNVEKWKKTEPLCRMYHRHTEKMTHTKKQGIKISIRTSSGSTQTGIRHIRQDPKFAKTTRKQLRNRSVTPVKKKKLNN